MTTSAWCDASTTCGRDFVLNMGDVLPSLLLLVGIAVRLEVVVVEEVVAVVVGEGELVVAVAPIA